ncbi:hypothetical protein GDO78_004423, partial [Eleutherodactylus coqui]
NVYVKMLTDSPFLVCMDIDMAYEETIDPKFLWIGPDGNVLEGHSNVNITETGKLMLKSFDKSMSGSYSCTLFYKRIKDDVSQEKELYKGYKFAVLGQAKKFIVEFFRMQTRVLQEEFVNVPEINYVEHSLDIIHVDSCRPGFGKNEVTHHDCPGCCVVCDPGTYSSFNNIHCEVCKDIKITDHGATEC